MDQNTSTERPDWLALLNQALSEPGKLSECYRVFHGYSLGNQILAAIQLWERGLSLSPIATFAKWQELGRHVKKGEKALALVAPVTVKRKSRMDGAEVTDDDTFTLFLLKRRWFSLAQTEGADASFTTPTEGWDKAKALRQLDVSETSFDMLDGNCQGFAIGRKVAVSPVAALPHKTLFHEIAHVLLGHTAAEPTAADSSDLPKSLIEAEAEAVAFLCCATLGLSGLAESRGYVQHWLGSQPFPDRSAARVFSVADKILKAGA